MPAPVPEGETGYSAMDLFIDRVASPVGALALVSDGRRLVALEFADKQERLYLPLRRRFAQARLRDTDDPQGFSAALRAYLDGRLDAIADLPSEGHGSSFEEAVWAQLRQIPCGTTTSYGAVARALGLPPASSRAVGLANGRNPVAIVVPCHRVIGHDGSLTGYGGGLERKRWLLEHEGALLPLG